MRYLKWVLSGLAAMTVILAGCSSHESGGISGVSSDDANRMNAEHSKFETSEDPPITAQTHFSAGQLAESQGNLPMALEQYKQTLTMDPKNLGALYRTGVIYTQLKQYPEAIEAWTRYSHISNNDATTYSNIGFCNELAGRMQEAEAAYLEGINRDPRNKPCHVNYGLMLARAGRTNESIVQLQAVLTPSQVHYNLGSVYEMQNKRELAKAEYRKAVELDPEATGARSRLAAIE